MTSFQSGPFRVLMMIAFTIASIFCIPQAVQARGILEGDTIPDGKTIPGDRFLYGTQVTMDGNVDGDVFAIGQEIVINGNVGGSLVAIGQKVTINSEVGGTLYSTALEFVLTPAAKLTRNLYFVGASMNTQTGSLVNRDLYAATLGAQMAGSVNGEVKAVIGPIEFFFLIMDWIEGSISLTSNLPTTTTISITDIRSIQSVTSASVVSAGLMDIQPALTALERIPLQQAGSIDWVSVGNWFLECMREWLILFAFGLLSLWLMPRLLPESAQLLRNKPLPATGWGLLGLVISFNMIGVVILLVVIIVAIGLFLGVVTLWELAWSFMAISGFSLGLASSIFALAVMYVSKAVVAYLVGKVILVRIAPSVSAQSVLSLVIGLIIYVFLAAIPILGWVFSLVVTVLGIGSTWLFYRSRRMPATLHDPEGIKETTQTDNQLSLSNP